MFPISSTRAAPTASKPRQAPQTRIPALMERRLGHWAGRCVLAALAGCLAAGCATYTDRINAASRSASAGNYEAGLSDLNKVLGVASTDELPQTWSGDRPLAALERGTLQQA